MPYKEGRKQMITGTDKKRGGATRLDGKDLSTVPSWILHEITHLVSSEGEMKISPNHITSNNP